MSDLLMPGLPVLRDDLELLPGPRARGGAPTWTVYDPVRSRYFRITQTAFELLSHWHLGDWSKIANAVSQMTGRRPLDGERDWIVRFLNINMLIRRESPAEMADLNTVGQTTKTSWFTWALHHYLFFRIPLVRPQNFLTATMPLARLFMSKTAMVTVMMIAILGGYLTVRQWDTYLATFMHFSNTEGFLWYGLALVIAKVFHELGHAYTAVRYGCRVPTMGVAFLVMWPVLYTDTSDAWRLTRKKERIAIGAAGMVIELTLAVLATLLWSFLPDGPARSAAFVIATITWIMTLAVNLNPFMRFDGYYLLSDALDVENLQDRSFSHARWWLRERLFGFGEAAPETFPAQLGHILIVYAIATWIYRLILFLGIAVLVYVFFFKLLGAFLFAVEIIWFIGLPIAREGLQWWKRRDAFTLNKNIILMAMILVGGGAGLVIPWQTTITVPTVLQAVDRAHIYAPVAARIVTVHVKRGDLVSRGDVLLSLESFDLNHQITIAQLQIATVRQQVRREAAGGSEAENIRILQRRLAGEISALGGLEDQKALLTVRSTIDGRVTDFDAALKTGLWINDKDPLAKVVALGAARLNGFIDELDVGWVNVGAQATFHPENPSQPMLTARVTTISDINSQVLDIAYLASVNGGDIPVETDLHGSLVPIRGIYRVILSPAPAIGAPAVVIRGTTHIKGAPQSLIMRAWNRVWSVLIRESGF
ncbi:MAG: HlyD family efflux transporter periplasmic adaptor subunit [Magnetovibrio sp.]|nr:HlyD family efflux transporter periplasmic adaptor subunit [Magnetovibrio sp.]